MYERVYVQTWLLLDTMQRRNDRALKRHSTARGTKFDERDAERRRENDQIRQIKHEIAAELRICGIADELGKGGSYAHKSQHVQN